MQPETTPVFSGAEHPHLFSRAFQAVFVSGLLKRHWAKRTASAMAITAVLSHSVLLSVAL